MAAERPPSALEELTNAAFNGVLLALERRRIPIPKFPAPIIVGIIAWPELRQSEILRDVTRGKSGPVAK